MSRIRMSIASAIVALTVSAILPSTAIPCGPGVHVRESDRIWSMLVDEYPAFKDLEGTPNFETYLHLGAIMPDFQWFLPIKQGHSSDFSVFLINRSMSQDPRFRAMALGHLMHNSVSDPLCEQFWTPTLMASAPLGMVSLLEGYSDNKGMSEGVTEVLGDPIVGDWDALIDMAYDIYFDGDEAKALGHEAIVWYVDEMNAYYSSTTDGEEVWQSLVDMIGQYEGYIAGFDAQGAKEFFHELRGDTPADMINFLTGDLIASVAGDAAKRNEDYDVNIRSVMKSAIVEQSFWDIYQDTLLADLSSFWYIDRIDGFAETMSPDDTPLITLGWPSWSGNAMVSGNIMSTMQFLPEYYNVIPGLIIDEVVWTNSQGTPISEVTADMTGSIGAVRIRYYTAHDFTGTLTLKVRGDRPGLDQSQDQIAGEHTDPVAIDPRTYVSGGRTYIEAPFGINAAAVDGFYFELYANDSDKPWFTSNWDTINSTGVVPVYQKIYRDNFATYGKWPPSLPVNNGLVPRDCEVFVVARTFAGGGPLSAAAVSLIPIIVDDPSAEPRTDETMANGIAAFDQVQAGTYQVTAEPLAGHSAADTEPTDVVCDPDSSGTHWVTREYHVIPKVWVNGGISPRNDCVVFNTNIDDFWGKAEKFLVTITGTLDESVIVPEVEKAARARIEVCFPTALENGTSITIRVVPKYVNGLGLGVPGVSDPITVDSTAPVVDSIEFVATETECGPDSLIYPFEVNLYVSAATSVIDKLEWSDGDGEWVELAFESVPGEIPYTERLTTVFAADTFAPGDDMLFRVTNRALVSTEFPAEIPASLACPVVVEPSQDIVETDIGGTDAIVVDQGTRDESVADAPQVDTVANDVTETTDTGSGDDDGGCSMGGGNSGNSRTSGTAGIILIALAMLGLLMYRRRDFGTTRD